MLELLQKEIYRFCIESFGGLICSVVVFMWFYFPSAPVFLCDPSISFQLKKFIVSR